MIKKENKYRKKNTISYVKIISSWQEIFKIHLLDQVETNQDEKRVPNDRMRCIPAENTFQATHCERNGT
jgi:hypothetical protein